ncbi:MAG TPA: universal stress protein [Smithella sp.]|nr:universal stress protein [Smithella sp.]MDM7986821.1 universal stress protein [Smithella sp.]HNY50826.1 universal stress protein [Smithella sp.]HOG91033.1 universal stress protein [Smithella sp.]HOU51142.1 universal stress protein [Smithella sp.]
MEDIKRILAVSWITQYCKETVHYAVSLASKYDAELFVIHVVDNSLLHGWNFPMGLYEEEHRKYLHQIQTELDGIINREKKSGMDIKTIVKEGEPVEEILKMVKKEKIDLLVLRANEESRIEHFLVGGSNDELIRMMPCSIFLVKNEPKSRVGRIKK